MKIYYDFQTLLNQRFGGISRYFFEIISRLKELSDLNINIQCFHSRNYYFKNQFRMVNIHNRIINGIDYRFASFVNKLIALHEIKLKNYDIIHPTYYNPYILKSPVKESCLIVTVHDMIHEKYIKQYPQLGTRDIEHKRIMVNAADWIIAVSECTKQDLLYYYPHLKEERISVIYHGSSYNPKVFNTHKLGGVHI